jgi:hypothetical protein
MQLNYILVRVADPKLPIHFLGVMAQGLKSLHCGRMELIWGCGFRSRGWIDGRKRCAGCKIYCI